MHSRDSEEIQSCDARYSRKEFLRRFVGPTVAAGVLLVPAKIVDKFSLQPAAAAFTGGILGRRTAPYWGKVGNPNGLPGAGGRRF